MENELETEALVGAASLGHLGDLSPQSQPPGTTLLHLDVKNDGEMNPGRATPPQDEHGDLSPRGQPLPNTHTHLNVENDVEANPGAAPSHEQSNLSPQLGDEILRKLVSVAGSTWSTCERTAAILTLLKKRNGSSQSKFVFTTLTGSESDWGTQERIRNKVFKVFIRQLRQKKTSLLAAYALQTCLNTEGKVMFIYDQRRSNSGIK